MTAPTQAQIEAAMSEYDRILVGIKRGGGTLTPENRREAMAAALTAAAIRKLKDEPAGARLDCRLCGQTYGFGKKHVCDPNLIHPGKDLTNVFPEEEP